MRAPIAEVPTGSAWARRAAEIRISHHHRQTSPLSLADCLLLGTAAVHGAAIATTDGPVARTARSEDLEVLALKDSNGRRP